MTSVAQLVHQREIADEPRFLVMFRNIDTGKMWHAHRLFSTYDAARDNARLLSGYSTLEARICKLTVAPIR